VGPTSPLSSTKEKEFDESLLLSLSRSLSSVDFRKTPILVTLDLKTLVTTSAEDDGNNPLSLSLSLWIDPEFEIGFLGSWNPVKTLGRREKLLSSLESPENKGTRLLLLLLLGGGGSCSAAAWVDDQGKHERILEESCHGGSEKTLQG
jgi:hypothetical protein